MSDNRALVVGVTGQDGSYLASYLLKLGYHVIGSTRDPFSASVNNLKYLSIADKVDIISLNPNDYGSVLGAITKYSPSEIYNLSGLTSVSLSFDQPFECLHSISTATVNFLESIRQAKHDIKFFNAGSSECFGASTDDGPCNELTPFAPGSPYAVAKAASFWTVSNYRTTYGLFCCTGILGNHESPLRPPRFVTQKIVKAAYDIKSGSASSLSLGNVNISRDWGWAPEYIQAMHLMLQQETANDYIIATGVSRPLLTFAELVFLKLGLTLGDHLVINPSLYRPNDLSYSSLDPSLISHNLGWRAKKSFESIVESMISEFPLRNVL